MNRLPIGRDHAISLSLLAVVMVSATLSGAVWVVLVIESIPPWWVVVLAPVVAALVAGMAWLWLVYLEHRAGRGGRAWLPALLGLPVTGAAAGLAGAAVNPVHHWLGNALTGAVGGTIAGLYGWWQSRSGLDRNKTPWSEREKFRAETWRTVLLGVLGSVAALWILKPWEQRADFAGEVLATKLRIKADAVEQFSLASYAYTVAAYKPCRDTSDTEAKRVWETEANVGVHMARSRLARTFDDTDVTKQLAEIVRMSNELHTLCTKGWSNADRDSLRKALEEKDDSLAGRAWDLLDLAAPRTGWWVTLLCDQPSRSNCRRDALSDRRQP
jgi:hypothetical protein